MPVEVGRCDCYPSSPTVRPPPKIYVTNWASVRVEGMAGPGDRRIAITEPSSRHTRGIGSLEAAFPSLELGEDMRLEPGWPNHNARYTEELWTNSREGATLRPGRLLFRWPRYVGMSDDEVGFAAVRNGDTLCCTCGRGKAAKGECHRVLLAFALRSHGWRVVLDGVNLDPHNSTADTPNIGDSAATDRPQ